MWGAESWQRRGPYRFAGVPPLPLVPAAPPSLPRLSTTQGRTQRCMGMVPWVHPRRLLHSPADVKIQTERGPVAKQVFVKTCGLTCSLDKHSLRFPAVVHSTINPQLGRAQQPPRRAEVTGVTAVGRHQLGTHTPRLLAHRTPSTPCNPPPNVRSVPPKGGGGGVMK